MKVGQATRSVADCVRTGRRPTRVTAADAVAGLEIVEAEKRSIETGQPVPL